MVTAWEAQEWIGEDYDRRKANYLLAKHGFLGKERMRQIWEALNDDVPYSVNSDGKHEHVDCEFLSGCCGFPPIGESEMCSRCHDGSGFTCDHHDTYCDATVYSHGNWGRVMEIRCLCDDD